MLWKEIDKAVSDIVDNTTLEDMVKWGPEGRIINIE